MRIIIKWLPQAITLLDNIYRFYSEKSQTAAIRLYNRLLDSAEPLRIFPQAGPIEPLLKGYDCEFRSLVVEKHYKLIYTVTDELIEIHAVWDCRRKDGTCKKCSNNLREETTKCPTIYLYIKNITNFVCLNESGRKLATKAKLKQIE